MQMMLMYVWASSKIFAGVFMRWSSGRIVDTESVVIATMTIAARRIPFATLRFTRA